MTYTYTVVEGQKAKFIRTFSNRKNFLVRKLIAQYGSIFSVTVTMEAKMNSYLSEML